MNPSRLNVLYWTKTLLNDNASELQAVMEQTFQSPIIQRANDYIMSVERFEVNLNGVPFYSSSNNESIIVAADEKDYQEIALTKDVYSLPDLIDYLNGLLDEQDPTSYSKLYNLGFTLEANGFVTMSFTNFATLTITLPTILNHILGIESEDIDDAEIFVTSRYPRWDIGDMIDHIRLVSNLDLVSDTVGQARTNIVTDVAVPSSISQSIVGISSENYSINQRQKLNYTPFERRYLNFSSPVPIQTIRVYAEYVLSDGSSYIINLPRGASFSVKFGFYYRG